MIDYRLLLYKPIIFSPLTICHVNSFNKNYGILYGFGIFVLEIICFHLKLIHLSIWLLKRKISLCTRNNLHILWCITKNEYQNYRVKD